MSFFQYLTIPFVGFFFFYSLASQKLSAQAFWSEKGPNAQALVSLPSIQPIIDELDATVVNISSTVEKKEAATPEGPEGTPPPFNTPEDFFERFFGGPNPQPRRSMGSGFIVSSDGYIITNNHVVEGADKIEVRVSKIRGQVNGASEQETYNAEVVGRDPRTDVALIKIKPKQKLPFAYLGNSDVLNKGDWVVAMGNPFGLEHSVSIGIVSAKGREISTSENRRFDDFIQTDAAINFGNSGGPLVNVKGEVVGMNTAITAQGSGIGFAVPINLVKQIVEQLKETGKVSRGYLGVTIQDVSPEIKEALGLSEARGVLVNDVVPNGPAARSALQSGDVILKVNDEPTPDARSLQREIGKSKPGSSVKLEIVRDSKKRQLSVKLGSLDTAEEAAPESAEKQDFDALGLIAKDSSSNPGVEIQAISPESPAALNGVIPGDRIVGMKYRSRSFEIKNQADYTKVVKNLKKGESILLNLRRMQPSGELSLFVAFRIP